MMGIFEVVLGLPFNCLQDESGLNVYETNKFECFVSFVVRKRKSPQNLWNCCKEYETSIQEV